MEKEEKMKKFAAKIAKRFVNKKKVGIFAVRLQKQYKQ